MIEAFADFVAVDATFLGESAFWAEGLAGVGASGEDVAERALVDAARAYDAEESAACEQLVAETRKLAALRLRGIEDNELVSVAA